MQLRRLEAALAAAGLALAAALFVPTIDSARAGGGEQAATEAQKESQDPQPVPVTRDNSAPSAPVVSDKLGPDQFGTFFSPQINDRGDVAFVGRYSSSKSSDGFGQAIFVRMADGSWKYVRDIERGQNEREKIHAFGAYSINQKGEIVFIATFGGRSPLLKKPEGQAALKEPTSSVERNSGLFYYDGKTLKTLLQLGQPVPNMPSRFSSFSNPTINSQGTIAFVSAYVDPDGRGLFQIEKDQLRIVARSGQRIAPGETMVFSEHYYPSRINEKGEIAFLSRVGFGAGIFVARAGGTEMIALDGRPSPVRGTKYLGFANRTPAINDKGDVVFAGFYDGPNAGRALFLKPAGPGPVKVAVSTRDPKPKYKFTDLSNPEINNNGDIVFIGRLEGRQYGIFTKTAKGIEAVAITGELAPGMKADGEEFNNFAQSPSINDRGDVVFYAQLRNASVGVFIKDAKGLRTLVKRGDKLPF